MTTASHVVAGHQPCPFLTCPEKAAGTPHYHTFNFGAVQTIVPTYEPQEPEEYDDWVARMEDERNDARLHRWEEDHGR